MLCKDVQKQLQQYLDGQLGPVESQAVDAHLTACVTCQQELALLRQVDDALATLPLLEEPAGFTARAMAQVRATKKAPSQPLPAFRLWWEDTVISFAFAGAMTTVLLALSLIQPQHVSTVKALLQQAWWTGLQELDLLWHTMQIEPAYVMWGLSALCVAAAATASAIVLLRQWSHRSMTAL
jgi:anti-sigma factor RsiW